MAGTALEGPATGAAEEFGEGTLEGPGLGSGSREGLFCGGTAGIIGTTGAGGGGGNGGLTGFCLGGIFGSAGR